MGTVTLGNQARPLIYTEAVLLVGDDKPQIAIYNIFRKQRVSADDQVKLSVFECGFDLTLLFCGHRACEQPNSDAKRR